MRVLYNSFTGNIIVSGFKVSNTRSHHYYVAKMEILWQWKNSDFQSLIQSFFVFSTNAGYKLKLVMKSI